MHNKGKLFVEHYEMKHRGRPRNVRVNIKMDKKQWRLSAELAQDFV